ncbi:hypothetical protein TYRP_016848 [Tyrophagus putrescentiae]|nr:hypothetical protein TYRP_016848 [Tyrophagus putrescentiae]
MDMAAVSAKQEREESQKIVTNSGKTSLARPTLKKGGLCSAIKEVHRFKSGIPFCLGSMTFLALQLNVRITVLGWNLVPPRRHIELGTPRCAFNWDAMCERICQGSPAVCAALSDFIRIEEIKAAATLSRRFSPDSSSLNDLHIFDNILQQIQQKQYRKKDAQKKTEEKTLKEKQEAEKRHREEQKKREDEKRRQEKEKELNKKRAKMCMQGNRWRDY